jgi:glycerophosphoryl diester phosphodiesterase
MLLFAHRGYHAEAPENSLAAFAAAVRLGVDGIETDVRLSRDGLPVIIHDRVTTRQHPVAGLTRREIEADVGHPVPILAEILDAFPDVLWNIEIKTPEAWPAAARTLAQFQRTRRLLVTSFRHDIVELCANELAIDCALLLAHRPLDVDAIMAGCAAYPRINAIVWDYNVIDESVLQAVTAGGWRNIVYGPVTVAEHERCLALDLAGLITDHPPRVTGNRA